LNFPFRHFFSHFHEFHPSALCKRKLALGGASENSARKAAGSGSFLDFSHSANGSMGLDNFPALYSWLREGRLSNAIFAGEKFLRNAKEPLFSFEEVVSRVSFV